MSHVATVDLYKQHKLNKERMKKKNKNLENICKDEISKLSLDSKSLSKIDAVFLEADFETAYSLITEYKSKNSNNSNLIKIESLEKYILSFITNDEYVIFSNIFERLENLKTVSRDISEDIEIIKNDFELLLRKYDKITEYMNILKEQNFNIDDFRYSNETLEFEVYASKNGRQFDCVSKGEKLNLHFEGFEADECLEELETIRDIAQQQYDLLMSIEDYESKPIDKATSNVGGGNSVGME